MAYADDPDAQARKRAKARERARRYRERRRKEREALAAKVLELLADEGLAERGRAGRRSVVAMWSNERLVDRHLEVYGGLTSKVNMT